jgi:NTE family protein
MHAQRVRNTVVALLESLPDDLKDEPGAKLLGYIGDRKVYNMVHLIYRAKNFRGNSKDYEFSRSSMEASSTRQLPRHGLDAAPMF